MLSCPPLFLISVLLFEYIWWLALSICSMERLRQEDCSEFKVKLGYGRAWDWPGFGF